MRKRIARRIWRFFGRFLGLKVVQNLIGASASFAIRLIQSSPRMQEIILRQGFDKGILRSLASARPPSMFLEPDYQLLLDNLSETEEQLVDIVIPVYGSRVHVEKCLHDLKGTVPKGGRVVIIDDGNTDSDIISSIESFRDSFSSFAVLRNEQNIGFTKSINRGVLNRRKGADVVILNSDTFGFNHDWLHRLWCASRLSPRVGTLTPWGTGLEPFGLTSADYEMVSTDLDGGIKRTALPSVFLEAPTGHGACLYIRSTLIDEIGLFDEKLFPFGYGEENDFCQRAIHASFRNLLVPSSFVRHVGSASFGEERRKTMSSKAISTLSQKHPSYSQQVRDFLTSGLTEIVNKNIVESSKTASRKPRLLDVNTIQSGGAKVFSDILSRRMRDYFDVFNLIEKNGELQLIEHSTGLVIMRSTITDDMSISQDSLTFEVFFSRALWEHKFDYVHFNHLRGIGRKASQIAQVMGCRTVFHIHDYHAVCPTVHLLDADRKFCGGMCSTSKSVGDCHVDSPLDRYPGLLRGDGKELWANFSSSFLRRVDVLVAPSETAKLHFVRQFQELPEPLVVPHPITEVGKNLATHLSNRENIYEGKELRILILGNIGSHKGSQEIQTLAKQFSREKPCRVRFMFLGNQDAAKIGQHHYLGPYDSSSLPNLIKRIKPHVAMFLSQWAETYNFAADEALLAKVPIISLRNGAEFERFQGQNFFFGISESSLTNPDKFVSEVKSLASHDFSTSISSWIEEKLRWDSEWSGTYGNIFLATD